MYRIQKVVKCYLFLILTRFLGTQKSQNQSLRHIFHLLVPDAKSYSGSISEVEKT